MVNPPIEQIEAVRACAADRDSPAPVGRLVRLGRLLARPDRPDYAGVDTANPYTRLHVVAPMYVVIFRATVRHPLDDQYARTAARLRDLALTEFGCLEFHAVTEGRDEVALSYWPDEASIRAWKAHPEHRVAQELGRTRWYDSYSVQIARVERGYGR